MEVSRPEFDESRNAPESARVKRCGELALYVKKSFQDSDDTCGHRRVHVHLVTRGVPAGAGTRAVADVRAGPACQPRPWKVSLTEGDGQEYDIPDLVHRDFATGRPAIKMVGDITYISTWEGWLFLATVIGYRTKPESTV